MKRLNLSHQNHRESNIKKSNTSQALWVGLGSLSSIALGIMSAAILSRYFEKTEYGTYRQILYVYTTLLVIFTAGLPQIYSFFLPRYSLAQGKDIVWKISKVLFLAGIVFSIFLFSFSGLIAQLLKNPELSTGLKFFAPIPMFLFPTLGIEGIFSTYQKTIYIAIYNTLTRTLMLLFIVLPVIIFKGSYLYAISGWLIVSIISLIIAYKFKKIPFKLITAEKSTLSFKEIFAYCFPLVSASIAGIAIKSADQFFISRYFGVEVFAEFANGFIQLPFVGMITVATSTVLAPVYSRMIFNKSSIDELLILWNNVIMKSATIIYPLVIFFIFFADLVIEVLYSKIYMNSIIFFRIAMILNFFNIITFAPLLLALGKVKIYSLVNIIFAIIIWIVGFSIVIFFKSSLLIAILSVSIGIFSVLFFSIYTSKQLGVSWITIFPVNKLLYIAVHSIIISSIVKATFLYANLKFNIVIELLALILLFFIALLLTAPPFRIDYLIAFRPFLLKLNSKIK